MYLYHPLSCMKYIIGLNINSNDENAAPIFMLPVEMNITQKPMPVLIIR